MEQQPSWPCALWIVRHGESIGNLAAARAIAAGAPAIDLPAGELDIPLSPLGERQARALGRWFAALPAGDLPTALLASPYARARQTAELARATAGIAAGVRLDERLREKDLGILNRLTRVGVAQHYPEQLELRARMGTFYYRPPGGESWCDSVTEEVNAAEVANRPA
ncbi:MAG TPA: histidine phosphatase family protein [Chloroflexota bacterium]|nr:histidine phosphatase family protein [Chloroflexota bacterium]